MEIDKFKFDETLMSTLYKKKYMKYNKPIVYFICNEKEGYVGISGNIGERVERHLNNPERKLLDTVYVIHDVRFNDSVTEEIERYLIRYIPAEGKYKLQNRNEGQKDDHDYSNKNEFFDIFTDVWKSLKRRGIVTLPIPLIKNSEIFKFSPYVYLDKEQYSVIKKIIQDLKNGKNKFLVTGGPGTGKTVLAVYLIKSLKDRNNELEIGLVVPNSTLRRTLRSVFKAIKGLNPSMIIDPNKVTKKYYDILIVDESHRLKRRLGLANYKLFDSLCGDVNKKPEESDELDVIEATSDTQIIFYDQFQKVRKSDIEHERILQFKKKAEDYKLKIQHRIKGGNRYIEFIVKLLNQKLEKPVLEDFDSYEFKIFDNIKELLDEIKQKNKEIGLCRMLAGYAWKWNKKAKYDFIIEGIKLKWNSKRLDWLNSKNSINEVGCIHTIQGYDLNYAGVIIGPEVTFDDKENKIKIIKKNYKDRLGKALADEEELKEFITDIYFVLLTRGIEGTYIYICDEKLREYFKRYVKF